MGSRVFDSIGPVAKSFPIRPWPGEPHEGATLTDSGPEAVSTSVIIAAHTFQRSEDLTRSVASALEQRPRPQVVVAVDNNPELYEWVCKRLPDVLVVDHRGARGASATRNSGVRAADGNILAFLDDDAVAQPGWLKNLIAPLARPDVVGVGGHVEPIWLGRIPRWLPDEFLWVVGATYRGMPKAAAPIRNVWSENMAVAREDFWKVGGFREGFGKTGLESSAGEDTDFCIRLTDATGGDNGGTSLPLGLGTWCLQAAELADSSSSAATERVKGRQSLRSCWDRRVKGCGTSGSTPPRHCLRGSAARCEQRSSRENSLPCNARRPWPSAWLRLGSASWCAGPEARLLLFVVASNLSARRENL